MNQYEITVKFESENTETAMRFYEMVLDGLDTVKKIMDLWTTVTMTNLERTDA